MYGETDLRAHEKGVDAPRVPGENGVAEGQHSVVRTVVLHLLPPLIRM